MLIRPNLTVSLYRKNGFDIYGKPLVSSPVSVQVAYVTRHHKIQKSETNAALASTRSNSEGFVGEAVLLFPFDQTVAFGDEIVIGSDRYEVSGVRPRLNVRGELDHYEVNARRITS